jgi:hypothetical protein
MTPILMEQAVGLSSSGRATIRATIPEGRTTVIILEPDGSLHQYSPDEPYHEHQSATVEIEGLPEPSLIERIFNLAFDRLKLRSVDLRICEEVEVL